MKCIICNKYINRNSNWIGCSEGKVSFYCHDKYYIGNAEENNLDKQVKKELGK